MPKFDRWLLTTLGITIALLFFTFGSFWPKQLHRLGNDQSPIDPLTVGGNFDFSNLIAQFHGTKFPVPPPAENKEQAVLGVNDSEKTIYVDLAKQKVYAFEGDKMVYEFLISSGKWGRTPTGTFTIWGKFRYTKMSGGSRALHTYYYLPNVPYVMFFSNNEIAPSRGFSLHGTYWHSNFGHPMSHGCINMKTEDAEKLFYWSSPNTGDKNTARATTDDPGTKVIIYGEAPQE